MSSKRELRFWPLLFGVYALVWGTEALLIGLLRLPLHLSFDLSTTDLAIFGIVLGVWLMVNALHRVESEKHLKPK